MPDAAALFRRHFGYPPVHRVRAPLGLALLGQFADFCEGLAMTVAVEPSVHFVSAPRADGRIEMVHEGFPEPERFWMSDLRPKAAPGWTDPLKGLLERLRQRGVNFSGFNAAIHCDEPIRAQAGESPMLAVAAALALRQLYPFSLTETGATVPPKRNAKNELPPLAPAEKWHFANLCGRTGQPGSADGPQARSGASGLGTLQAAASLFGKAWQVASLDLRFRNVEFAPIVGTVIVFCQPDRRIEAAAPHGPSPPNSAGGQEFREICETAAGKLGVRSLRSADLRFLESNKSRLTAREYGCVRHIVTETARVVAAERSLRADDVRQFGQYLFQSQESLRQSLPAATAEIEPLIELARAQAACFGVCVAEGECGEATLNLVAHHQSPDFANQIALEYERRTGRTLRTAVCPVVDGAH